MKMIDCNRSKDPMFFFYFFVCFFLLFLFCFFVLFFCFVLFCLFFCFVLFCFVVGGGDGGGDVREGK